MPTNPMTVVVTVGAPPRGVPPSEQIGAVFTPAQCVCTWSWGLQPATALIDWVSATSNYTIYPNALATIQMGGHTFYGVMKEITPVFASDGRTLMQQFVDLREFLMWDITYGAFNRRENKLVNGKFIRRYWHILPRDFPAMRKTYTNAPYSAAQILDFLFGGPTVESPWLRAYDANAAAALAHPCYELDMGGKTLGQAVLEVSERMGTVFTLLGGPYNLQWTMKGFGTAGSFPANSDHRRGPGLALSGWPTRVNILGDRSVYQALDLALEPDWAPGWQAFYTIDDLADDLFQFESTEADIGGIGAGTAYNAVPGDPYQLIGRQLAMARALTITVGQYADIRDAYDGTGGNFRDYRKFDSRSRLGMPAALYLKTIAWRAFRPPAGFRLTNHAGQAMDVFSMELQERALVEVSHDPATGVMSWAPDVITATNGYAIARGYQVGSDAFKTLNPDRFQLEQWVDSQSIWQHVEFHIDDSGEGSQFILFDEPVIVSADAILEIDGYPVLNDNPTLAPAPVRAALVWAGERFSYVAGVGTKDGVENVPGLSGEYVAQWGAITELPYADGQKASQKAAAIANSLLNRQFYYSTGGYTVQGSNGTQLSSLIDRVTVRVSADGLTEEVDYTNERARNATADGRLQLIPERDFDRRESLQPLLPGQRELVVAANQAKLLAVGLKQSRRVYRLLADAFHDLYGFDAPPQAQYLSGATGGALAAGTPIWREAAGTDPRPVSPLAGGGAPLDEPVFVGIVAHHQAPDHGPVPLTATGVDGVAFARVQGPVNVNDPVGFDSGGGNAQTFLIAPGTPAVGLALEAISDTTIKLVRVRMGAGKGGTAAGAIPCAYQAQFGDYLVCLTPSGGTVRVAKVPELRNSLQKNKIYGVEFDYGYPRNPPTTPPGDAMAYVRRAVTWAGGNLEYEDVVQPFLTLDSSIFPLQAASTIWAEAATTGMPIDPLDTTAKPTDSVGYIDTNRAARAWMRSPNQATA